MDYIVITSKGLANVARTIYKEISKVDRIPKEGIITIPKGLYIYTHQAKHYYQEKVKFDPPFEDIEAVKRQDKTWWLLDSFKDTDRVMYIADHTFKYSVMLLWEIHHAFGVKVDQMIVLHEMTCNDPFKHIKDDFKQWKPKKIIEFDAVEIRHIIALSFLKLALHHYCKSHIYGHPINFQTFLEIRKRAEYLDFGRNRREISELIKQIDISTPRMRVSDNARDSLIVKSLSQMMAEDIDGYTEEDFLEKLHEKMVDVANQRLNYNTYKEGIKKMFDIERREI